MCGQVPKALDSIVRIHALLSRTPAIEPDKGKALASPLRGEVSPRCCGCDPSLS